MLQPKCIYANIYIYKDGSSRIDHIYVPQSIQPHLVRAINYPMPFSDHNVVLVTLKLDLQTHLRRDYVWHLNASILTDEEYVSSIKSMISNARKQALYKSKPSQWWYNFKKSIIYFSKQYSLEKSKN